MKKWSSSGQCQSNASEKGIFVLRLIALPELEFGMIDHVRYEWGRIEGDSLTFFWCWRFAWWWPSSMTLFRSNDAHYIQTQINEVETRSRKYDCLLLLLMLLLFLLELSKWRFFSVFNNRHFIIWQVPVVFFLLLLRRRRRCRCRLFLLLCVTPSLFSNAFSCVRSIDQSLPLFNRHLNYV